MNKMLFLGIVVIALLLSWQFKAFMQDVNVLTPQKAQDTHIVSTRTLMTKATANALKVKPMLQKGIQDLMAKKTDIAIQDLTQVLKQDPKNIAAWNNLGICYNRQKEWQKSNEAYEKAVSINPHYPLAHYNLALNACETKHFPKAIHEYKTLKANAPFLLAHLKQAFDTRCPALKLPPELAKMPKNGIVLLKNQSSKVSFSVK